MKTYEKYGISVGQIYTPADGSKSTVKVVDVETFADCDDVVVFCSVRNIEYRIDCFKLAMVRYCLVA